MPYQQVFLCGCYVAVNGCISHSLVKNDTGNYVPLVSYFPKQTHRKRHNSDVIIIK